MLNATPLEETMNSEAEFGLFYAYSKISHQRTIELRKQGFIVTDSLESCKFPRLHRICWAQAVVETTDVKSLNENDDCYTPAQKLWIISMKNS